MTVSPALPNIVATCSADQTVKVWDFSAEQPRLIFEKDMHVGELFTVDFYEEDPYILACGGTKGELAIWDLEENPQIVKHFFGRDIEPVQVEEGQNQEVLEEN